MEDLQWVVLEWLFLRIIPTIGLLIFILGPREWFLPFGKPSSRSRTPYYEAVTELWYQSYDHDARLRSCMRSSFSNKSSSSTGTRPASRVSFSNQPSIRHYSPLDRSNEFLLKERCRHPITSSLATLVVKGCWNNSSTRNFRRSRRLNILSTSKRNTPLSTGRSHFSEKQAINKPHCSTILRPRASVPVFFSRKREGPVEV